MTTYGMEMNAATASTYKSLEMNRGKKKAAKAPKKATTPAPMVPLHGGTIIDNGIVASMHTIKALVKRLGAAQVKQMVDLFA